MRVDKLGFTNSIEVNNITNKKSKSPETSLITEEYFINRFKKIKEELLIELKDPKLKFDLDDFVTLSDKQELNNKTLNNVTLKSLLLDKALYNILIKGLNAEFFYGKKINEFVLKSEHSHENFISENDINKKINKLNSKNKNELDSLILDLKNQLNEINLKLEKLDSLEKENKSLKNKLNKLDNILNIMNSNDSENITDELPIGTILLGIFNKSIKGFLECDGSVLNRKKFQKLYEKIGTQFGYETSYDFKLPELKHETLKYYIKY